jgi:small redox-active disulfide protein 2
MIIKILGTGCCSKCKQLEANVKQAVDEMGIEATIEKVESLEEIMRYGVMQTPALVIDGQVKVVGKLLSAKDVKKYLQ